MNLNAPKKISWLVALVLGVIGIIFMLIPAVSGLAFWVVLVGLVLMLLATYLEGL